jgi:D-xylose 1-dehydrogenase (NADP+, D-xylono-1,5-lactone-forming)
MSAQEPIRWGLLGTSRINAKLLAGARLSENAEVVAVGSRSAEIGGAFAAANGIMRAHGTYEGLLADPDVDAVYIPLPNALHHRWTLEALAAGKHVLCEKPYSRHPEQVDEAWDAADAAGRILMEAFMWRHTPQADRLVQLVAGIGQLVAVHATFSHRLRDDRDIRVSASLEGGALMDVGCYCVSAARLVAGEEPELVFGQQVTTAEGVDRRFAGLLRFPSGLVATFHAGFDAFSESLEVIGREGSIVLPDPWHSLRGLLILDGDEVRVEAINPYQCELDDMAAAIRGQKEPRLGRADALGQARAIEALYRSAETGAPMRLA